jgi:hypothetical protein
MSKEKFESLFLAGGLMLNVLSNRLRREPKTTRESIGAAVHTLGRAVEEHRDALADPGAVTRQIVAIREELCADRPDAVLLSAYVEELAGQVRDVDALVEPVEEVRRAVARWFG